MQKAKTRMIGVGGLALLAALTTAAINIPAQAETASSEVNIEVVVYSASPDIKFQAPLDGVKTSKVKVSVVDVHSKAVNIQYLLKKNGQTVKEINYTPETQDGVHRFEIDMTGLGYGEYTIQGTVTGDSGKKAEDMTSFRYVPLTIVDSETEKGKNPTIEVEYGPDVDKVCFDVMNKKGDVILTLCNNAEKDGDMKVELPFDEYGAPDGDYVVIATPVIDGQQGENDQITIKYKAPSSPDVPSTDGGDDSGNTGSSEETPNVPNTGLFQKLGMSRADTIITSLIGFFMVVILALFLMNRKKGNRRR